MNPVNELIMLFKEDKIAVNDNLMTTSISKVIEFNQIPNYNNLMEALSKFNKRDSVTIYLKDEAEDSITITNSSDSKLEYEKFIRENETIKGKINLKIDIKKEITNNKISIFNIKTFLDNFLNNTIVNNLKFFDSRFKHNSNIIFVNYDNDYTFNTNSIIMTNNDSNMIIEQIDRKEILERCNSVSNFSNSFEYALLPEDFSIITTNIRNDFIERFQEIKVLFSLVYIADYSALDETTLKLKMNGYRHKDYTIELNSFKYKENYNEFYKIYHWIFQDANEYDKIELTRNVISMYCKNSDILDIDEKTFLAIKSNYKIYLKENVDKFIDLKNKLTEFIMNTSNQINDIIGSFVGNFGKNIIAFITFLLGTVIANIVSDSPLNNIFTKDIVKIIIIILAGSIVYLLISIEETYYKFKSYKKSYTNLKNSYTDILNEQDIEMIFKKDKEYISNKYSVIKVVAFFSILWIIFDIVVFLIIAKPNM